jgi:hypothetical protein
MATDVPQSATRPIGSFLRHVRSMRVEIGRSQLLQRLVEVNDVNATDLGPDEFVVPTTKNDEKLPDRGFTGHVANSIAKAAE